MENSAGPDCAAENRGWIVLNSLWTFLWKTRKNPFSTSPVEYALLITENFVEKRGILSLQRKNQRNSKCSGENVRCCVKYIPNPVPGINYLKFFAYFLSRK